MDLKAKSIAAAERWLQQHSIDESTKEEVRKLIEAEDPKPLINSFYQNLEFGTGGLRGVMGVGSNCINKYTVGAATQGLANYLRKTFGNEKIKVAIAYDSRNQSKFFAEVAADVFASNGIQAFIFPELRPTPLLSFAVRHLKCHSGVVITASHNPKEYNGYKAYWSDGAQLVPPHDKNVITEVNSITSFDQIKFDLNHSLIHEIGREVEEAYYAEIQKLIPARESIKRQSDISIVYSGIHGSGITMVPECLRRLGFQNCVVVEEQKNPDGDFPTVASPNPEEPSAMRMAMVAAKNNSAELVMATDPDADRVGIGIKDRKGDFFLLNGNQAFALMMAFILKNLDNRENKYIAKTIVTTELIDAMAAHYGVECHNTLTGFKYIAELIRTWEGKKTFVAAGEESYGYMVGDFVRDKDAISSCAFFAAMAASAKDQGQTLYDWLLDIYVEFGFYKEGLLNVVKKGADGAQEISNMMAGFRQASPTSLAGETVTRVLDYKSGIEKNIRTGETMAINLPKSDVLQFYTERATKVSVRPSGTEPKIKFYIAVRADLKDTMHFEKVNAELDMKIKSIETQLTQ